MRSEEALAGFQRLQRHFKGDRGYKGADLNPIWPDLLPLSLAAFERAIGIIMKNGKFLPEPGYVLEQTRHWEQRMRQERPQPSAKMDPDAMARESTRLTRGYLEGTLPLEEYISGLYLLSEKTGCVEYAELARRKERKLRGENHDC